MILGSDIVSGRVLGARRVISRYFSFFLGLDATRHKFQDRLSVLGALESVGRALGLQAFSESVLEPLEIL